MPAARRTRRRRPQLPPGEYFTAHALAPVLAPALAMDAERVTTWLARAIAADPPRVRSVRVEGEIRIPRAEAERLLSGGRRG